MPAARIPIPKKARRRTVVPWQYSIGRELTADELQVVGHRFLAGTKFHKLISGDVYPGITIFNGDYWGTQGRDRDLSQVASRWDEVEEQFPDIIVDATIEYRVTEALQDERKPIELTDANGEVIAEVSAG